MKLRIFIELVEFWRRGRAALVTIIVSSKKLTILKWRILARALHAPSHIVCIYLVRQPNTRRQKYVASVCTPAPAKPDKQRDSEA
jgi:hypothetical protein